MKTELPTLIKTYVQASNEIDVNTYIYCFTDSATVVDDGETLVGHEAIAQWFEETQTKYNSTTEPLRVRDGADQIVLTAKVSGTFKGSPLSFDYFMDLKSGLIQKLRIEFRG